MTKMLKPRRGAKSVNNRPCIRCRSENYEERGLKTSSPFGTAFAPFCSHPKRTKDSRTLVTENARLKRQPCHALPSVMCRCAPGAIAEPGFSIIPNAYLAHSQLHMTRAMEITRFVVPFSAQHPVEIAGDAHLLRFLPFFVIFFRVSLSLGDTQRATLNAGRLT